MRHRLVLVLMLVLSACGRQEAGQSADPPPPPERPTPAPDRTAWLGRWNGPEGLFLQIDRATGGGYQLTLKDTLDSQAVYPADADAKGLTFVRDGERLTIHPGSGAETGFKWLAEKTDCLIVVPGKEGYCRG